MGGVGPRGRELVLCFQFPAQGLGTVPACECPPTHLPASVTRARGPRPPPLSGPLTYLVRGVSPAPSGQAGPGSAVLSDTGLSFLVTGPCLWEPPEGSDPQ